MFKRFFRNPLPKILLMIEIVISLVVLSNIWSAVEKYCDVKVVGNNDMYRHNLTLEVSIEYGEVDDGSGYDMAKSQLADFIEEISDLGGNIYVYPVIGNVGEGGRTLYALFLSSQEPVYVPLESSEYEFGQVSGVYVGNQNLNYINRDNSIYVFSDRMKVIGIMASYGFEKCSDIYVNYHDLSEVSKEESIREILSDSYGSGVEPVTIQMESDVVTEDSYIQSFSEIIKNYTMLSFEQQENNGAVSVPTDESIYKNIKYGFMVLAVFFVIVLLFQTTLLILHGEKNNIFVMKTYGISDLRIFMRLYSRILAVFGAAVVIAAAGELIIYHFIMRYSLLAVRKNMIFAAVGILAVISLVIFAAYAGFRKKTIASELTKEEM